MGSISGESVTLTDNALYATNATQQIGLSGIGTGTASVTLSSSANPQSYGGSVTFTAVVTPGTPTPTGTVTFFDGPSTIGSRPLINGQATFATSTLAAGTHTITASYGGDAYLTGNTGPLNSNPQVVVAPPVMAVAFDPAMIPVSTTTSLGFTITNPAANTTVALTGVAVTDTLPAGVTVAGGTASACGGTLTTTAPASIALTGGNIAVGGNCVFSVTVTGAKPGTATNTTGAVSATNGGTGNAASANLTVTAVAVSPSGINFGDVNEGSQKSAPVSIRNLWTMGAPLAVSLTPGSGTNASRFHMQGNCLLNLAAGRSCTQQVTFYAPDPGESSRLGQSTATLKVTSGASTQSVPLQANVIDARPRLEPGRWISAPGQ